jgi:hypothetical protein
MVDGARDEPTMPKTKRPEEKRPYVRPSLRRLGSVRELTAGGTSPTMVDFAMMRPTM